MTETSFSELNASKKLLNLSKNPPDLPSLLDAERMERYRADNAGFTLLYGTERVDGAILKAFDEMKEERALILKMQQLQAGEPINEIIGFESEKRAVLHTAMRDLFEKPNNSKKAQDARDLAGKELEKLKIFLEKNSHFTDIVQIGIGGSDLGPRAIYHALEGYKKPGRSAHFISNVDPDDAHFILKALDLTKTLILVVSKSGNTIETLTNERIAREYLIRAGLSPEKHLVAITGKGSPMDDPESYLESFYIWDYIGGRYAATSMVGAVLLAFTLGMDKFLDFLHGAKSMDLAALDSDLSKNLPLLGAFLGMWNRNFLGHKELAVIPYAQPLCRFAAHLQQLDMESNGKQIDRFGRRVDFETGPLIFGEPGTNAQHSFFQWLHQGTTVVPLEFIAFKKCQGEDLLFQGTTSQEKLLSNLGAQMIAFAKGQTNKNPNKNFPGNRPSHLLIADKLTPRSVGALLAYHEHKVAFQGFIWGINSFDQEGVQLGKVLGDKLCKMFAAKRKEESVDSKDFAIGKFFFDFFVE